MCCSKGGGASTARCSNSQSLDVPIQVRRRVRRQGRSRERSAVAGRVAASRRLPDTVEAKQAQVGSQPLTRQVSAYRPNDALTNPCPKHV